MALPPCHSRRELPTVPVEYWCAHPQVHVAGQRVHEGICGICSRWRDPPPAIFRAPPPPMRRPGAICEFLGKQIGTRECPTCRGKVRLKVFACSHPAHDETTLPDCDQCQDFQDSGNSTSTLVSAEEA
jgi:hypothetical protein